MIERIFNVVIEKEEYDDLDERKDEIYFIHCPQLKGCMSQGISIEDALLMFSDALKAYMESVIKHKEVV